MDAIMVRVDADSFRERQVGRSHHDFNRSNSGPRADVCGLLKCGCLGAATYVAEGAMHINQS